MNNVHRRLVAIGIVVMLAVIGGLFYLSEKANDEALASERAARIEAEKKVAAQLEAEQAQTEAQASRRALRSQCEAGIRSACDQLRTLPTPSAPETDDPETQDPEVQEPEVQEPERQDPERQDPETQDPESQDPEAQDGDPNDPETQDAEVDDPEIQDPEIDDSEQQDPEIDDPDPNSAIEFRAADNCAPAEGHVVSDVGLTVSRGDGVVTYTITCQTVAVPGPPAGAAVGS